MSTLTISRVNNSYQQFKPWKIKIDNHKVEKIKNNSTKTLEIQSGTHLLQVGKSNKVEITVEENQEVNVNVVAHQNKTNALPGFLPDFFSDLFSWLFPLLNSVITDRYYVSLIVLN